MDAHVIAQLCMLATLILMITGKTPIYLTAITPELPGVPSTQISSELDAQITL